MESSFSHEAETAFQEALARELNRVIRERFGSVEQKAAKDLGISRQRLRRYTGSHLRMTPRADLFLHMVAAWDLRIEYGGIEFSFGRPRGNKRQRPASAQLNLFDYIEEPGLKIRIMKKQPGKLKLALEIRASA